MTGIENKVFLDFGKALQRLAKGGTISRRKVGTAYRILEKGIARKEVLANSVADRACGMTGGI